VGRHEIHFRGTESIWGAAAVCGTEEGPPRGYRGVPGVGSTPARKRRRGSPGGHRTAGWGWAMGDGRRSDVTRRWSPRGPVFRLHGWQKAAVNMTTAPFPPAAAPASAASNSASGPRHPNPGRQFFISASKKEFFDYLDNQDGGEY